MRVHHINCATMCPPSARLVNGRGSLFAAGRMVCHCLVLETGDGLALVDTGLGTADIADPRKRLGGFFMAAVRPTCSTEETALAQLRRLGFDPADVRHIFLTHLDLDHAGGLPDFPQATVHVFGPEREAALARATGGERRRYRPLQWAHQPRWHDYQLGGEKWFGFEGVRGAMGSNDEILLVPLIGHTRGHCGVAVKGDDGWLLHAGDAYFAHGEVHQNPPKCPPGLVLFQRMMEIHRRERLANQARLRELATTHGEQIHVFCAHDAEELELDPASASATPEQGDIRTASAR